MIQSSIATKLRWRVGAFVAVGAALLGLALSIAFTTPEFGMGFRFFDATNMETTVATLAVTGDTRRLLLMNVTNGSIYTRTTSTSAGTVDNDVVNKKRIVFTRLDASKPMFPAHPYLFFLRTDTVNGAEDGLSFELPVSPAWLADSIFVGSDGTKCHSIDASSHVRSELPHRFAGTASRLIRLSNTRSFLCVSTGVPSTSRGGGPKHYAELLEVDNNGQLKSRWVSELYSEFSVEVRDGKIYYVSPEARHVACLNPTDLSSIPESIFQDELVERFDKFKKSNMGTCDITLRGRIVSFLYPGVEHCHYLLPEMTRVETSDKFTYAIDIKGKENLLGLGVYEEDLVALTVINLINMRQQWRHKMIAIDGFAVKDGTFIFTNAKYGCTAEVLDVQTGEVLIHRTPFAWLTWALPLLLLGSTIWSWQLVRGNRLEGVSRWVLAASLSVVFVGVLVTFLTYWGYHQFPVVTHQYLQGYFVAALSVAGAWIVWGNGRLLFRCLPLFVMTVFLIVLARGVLSELNVAVEAVGTTLFMASLTLPLFCLSRWCGLGKPAKTSVSSAAKLRVPMRDLFVMSTVVAILLAAALPLAQGIRLTVSPPRFIIESLIAEALMLVGFCWAVICYFKRWNAASLLTLLVLISLITLEAVYEFVTAKHLIVPRDHFTLVLFRITSTATLLFVILLQCCLSDVGRNKLQCRSGP